MKISFIGLGAMGYPMAGHLPGSHKVTVWNRTDGVAQRHAKEFGSHAAESLAECANAEVVISILPTSVEVNGIVERLLPHLERGTLWIDATSGEPEMARDTAATLAAAGVGFVDAPVTGGVPGAEKGTLTVMMGGAADDAERATEIMKAYGAKIFHVGGIGTGNAIKAMANTMMATNMLIAAECLYSLRKLGFDMKLALDVLNAGSGRSNVSENLLPKRLVDGEWPATFKLWLLDKDVRIATSIMHDQHLSAPIANLASQLYTAALREKPDSDYIEIVKFVAALNGEEW
ncbi:MAG TPA: NAD(P)-dependent oxidoreductase [Thermoanaerobaculia bacterium]|nr:NAD(P)-dependent oxidoreductase [Thermoanaerobaculia bacterium]